MKEFSHPHIIELFGWTMRDQDYFILMELAPYGEVGVELGCHGNCICTKTWQPFVIVIVRSCML